MARTPKPPLNNERDTGLGGLLVHLPEYQVVICKDCRFAIQPSAFSSHLQNHHIFRSERRSILEQLSSLRLPPPDRVGIPPSDSKRIADLPILSGHKCDTAECNYACTSLKRMCQHWSEVHDEPNSRAIKIRDAMLQTFFRGNKIRYFEVEGPPDSQCWTQKQSQAAAPGGDSTPHTVVSPSASTNDSGLSALEEIQAPALDYQALHYIHHYIRNSGFYLDRGNETTQFWVDAIVFEAYRNPFLMHAILGMAAVDKARRATDYRERRLHMHASASYRAGIMADYRAAVASPNASNSNAIVACSRLLGVQEIVSDLIIHSESGHIFTIDEIIEHIVLWRGCSDLLVELQPTLPADSVLRLPADVEVSLCQFATEHHVGTAYDPSYVPADIWLILCTLEAKLKGEELLSDEETPMIHHCIHNLACATSQYYEARVKNSLDHPRAGWNAAEGWLRSPVIAEGLLPAMRDLRPAAMAVFASWSLILVKQVEASYDWMTGLSAWFVTTAARASPGTQVREFLQEVYKLD